jgi:hypothetical protein
MKDRFLKFKMSCGTASEDCFGRLPRGQDGSKSFLAFGSRRLQEEGPDNSYVEIRRGAGDLTKRRKRKEALYDGA